MSEKARDWVVALSYVALIYATLEIARFPLAFLRAHGVLRLSLGILFSLAAVAVVFLALRNHRFSVWRILALAGIGGSYFLAAQTVKTPEEQVHFFEYGLVGYLFLRAVSHSFQKDGFRYTSAWLLACSAGWIDELLQGISPHRHYDLHDVKLNAISAAMGLLIHRISRPEDSPR